MSVRAAPPALGGNIRSDRKHRSADHDTWVPRCPGCLPEDVRPHRCQGAARGWGGGHAGWCQCADEVCREKSKSEWRRQRQSQAEIIAGLQQQLLERGLVSREDFEGF